MFFLLQFLDLTAMTSPHACWLMVSTKVPVILGEEHGDFMARNPWLEKVIKNGYS
jgi:hypothetical protein